VGLHSAAVERAEQELAVAQVLGAVEQQHGALANDRAEHHVGLAGAELLVRSLEQLLDQRRMEHHHESLVEKRAERHSIAVPAPAGVDETGPAEHEAQRLQSARQAGAWGESIGCSHVHM
jgi:hypothetical protein